MSKKASTLSDRIRQLLNRGPQTDPMNLRQAPGENSGPLPSVFLSYSAADRQSVAILREKLTADGFRVWFDRAMLLPGQDWVNTISEAMRQTDVLLICLSQNTSNEKSGFFQREISFALEMAAERDPRGISLIPLRLEECDVPPPLRRYQWIDIFESDGYSRLRKALTLASPRNAKQVELEQIELLRDLLMREFHIAQLRQLTFELPQGRVLYNSLPWDSSTAVVINALLRYLEREGSIDDLQDLIARIRPDLLPNLSGGKEEAFRSNVGLASRTLPNPYVVGNPVQPSNKRVFVGRFDIAHALVGELKKARQRPSILLYGRRRMGKTSTLLNIRQITRDPALMHVYISCQSAKFHTDRDFCYYFVQAVKERMMEDFGDFKVLSDSGLLNRDAFKDQPILRLAEFFDIFEAFLESRNIDCLFAIDEYEELNSHMSSGLTHDGSQSLSTQLLIELRNALQHKQRIMFLMSGTHFMRELSGVDWSSIFINIKTLHVSFLSRRDGELLLTQPVPEISYLNEGIIERVLDITGCQPLLLQAMGSEIVNHLNFIGSREVDDKAVRVAAEEVLKKQNTYFSYLWEVECEDSEGRNAVRKLVEGGGALQRKELSSTERSLKDLARKEILRLENDQVALTMPLFAMWMRRNEHLL